jgi:hypothetical protein
MMKKLLLSLIILQALVGHSQKFDWVTHLPSTSGSGGTAMTKDQDGNIYTVATFVGQIQVGLDTVTSLGNFNSSNVLLTKWSPDGELLDYKQLSATSSLAPYDLAYQENLQQVILTTGTLGEVSVVSDTTFSTSAVVLLRFDTDLNFVSSFNLTNTYYSPVQCYQNDIYSCSDYVSSIRRIAPDNSVLWSTSCTSGGFNISSITPVVNGRFHVIGYAMTTDPVTFGSISIAQTQVGSYDNVLVFTFDTTGQVIQGRYLLRGSGYGNPVRIDCSNEDEIYIACTYQIAGQTLGSFTIEDAVGANSVMLARLNGDLEPLWVKSIHNSAGNMEARCLSIGANNNLFVAGLYGGVATLGTFTLPASIYGICYAAAMNSSTGETLRATYFGTFTGTSRPFDMVVDGNRMFITGLTFSGEANTGSFGCFTDNFYGQFLTAIENTDVPESEATISLNGNVLEGTHNFPDATYSWYLDGTLLENETSNTLNISSNGTYIFEASYFGCSESDTLVLLELGLKTVQMDALLAYPNPAKDQTFIQSKSDSPITVYDLSGRAIMVIASQEKKISLANLPMGVYLVKQDDMTLRLVKN